MRRIGEALHIPEIAKCNQSTTPLRMTFNPLSVYASKSKLAPGNFSEILSPLSDPHLDEISDNEDGCMEKGEEFE